MLVASPIVLSCLAAPVRARVRDGSGAMHEIDRKTARDVILATLAADAGCDPAAFDGDGITVVAWREVPGRRRFEPPAMPFQILTMGHGVVVSCHPDWLDWFRERAALLDRSAFFASANLAAIVSLLAEVGLSLAGPHPSYGCSVDTLHGTASPPGIAIDVWDGRMLGGLRSLDAFRNALAPRPIPARPDKLAVTARVAGEIIACAGASAENDRLWQVGVDVLAPWRGRGVGRAVVSRLTEAILDAGKVPYYSHSVSNIPSAALATSLGYWPAWVQWHARESR